MAIYDLPFSKWLCDWAWDNRMPYAYSTDLRNIRIVNQVSTVRKWFKTIVWTIVWTTIKGLVSNNWNLYAIVDSKLKKVNFTTNDFDDIWDLLNDNDINAITFWTYTILLTWTQPYVYDGTTLSQISTYPRATTSYVFSWSWVNDFNVILAFFWDWKKHTWEIIIDWTGTPNTFKYNIDGWAFIVSENILNSVQEITYWDNTILIEFWDTTGYAIWDKRTVTQTENSKPRFWEEFLNFTWIVWWWDLSNIIYQSRPIISTNQEYCYDWVWSWANQLIMKSNIQWLVSTVSRLIIFTDTSIEYIDRSSYVTIWWILNFYPNPIAQWVKLANNRCCVSAWEKVFFLTADKKIKSIDYIQWIDDLKVWDLSDDEKVGIPNLMNSLNDDLSESVGFYDQKNKLIKFFVRSKTSLSNDLCIIWDLVNKTFLVDDNKFYSILENHDNKVYAWSCLNSTVYQDESWEDDDWWDISWYRYSAILQNGRPWKNKMYTWFSTSWTINSQTKINKDVILDWDIIDSSTIEKDWMITWWTASSQTAWIMTWWYTSEWILRNFTKNRWPEYINTIWRYLQTRYSWSWIWQNFTLETCETQEKLTNYEELTDK